ncbi:MAG: aldo/keto reductase [Chloroflexi bacterium]|nr:aldo/keto reductase [Chloroflexota bacterium]
MKYVSLGDRRVSAIGLGTWQFGSPEWGWGRDFGSDDARKVVHQALDSGITFFDTAEIYGRGRSEEILGAALRERDVEVMVATKVWPTRIGASAVVAAARRSLARLQRASLDLYQIHWPNPVVPLAWTMQGMRRLLDQRLVGSVGVSNFSAGRWARAETLLGSPVVSNQIPYSLVQRSPERSLLPYAVQSKRAIIAYSPLAQGLFSGAYGPGYIPSGARSWNPLFSAGRLVRAEALAAELQVVGERHAAKPTQIALAWTIRSGNVIAIPGARRDWQVAENAAAADIELSDEEAARIEAAALPLQLGGGSLLLRGGRIARQVVETGLRRWTYR